MILHGIVVTKNIFETTLNFNKNLYLDDIKLIDWHEILYPEKNVNEKVQEALNTLNNIVEKHAPIKLASQSKQRQLNKPWLTKDINKKETENVLYTFLKQGLTKNRGIYILCSYSFTC